MKPPPLPITKEQFFTLIKSMASQGFDAIMNGNAMMPDPLEIIWEVTRPGSTCEEIDLLPEVEHVEGTDALKQCVLMVYIDTKDNPILGFVHNTGTGNKAAYDKLKESPAYDEAVRELVDRKLNERFPNLNPEHKMLRPDEALKQHLAHNVEAEVEEFRNSMDSIFDTWKGGES